MGAKKRSSGRRKRGPGKLGPILLYGGMAAALVGAVVFAILSTRKGGPDADETPQAQVLRYLPDDVGHVRYTQVARVMAHPDYPKLRALAGAGHTANLGDHANIKPEEVERVVEGGGRNGILRVVTLREPMTPAEIRQRNTSTAIATSWSEEKVNGQTLHVVKTAFRVGVEGAATEDLGDARCFFMPDSRTVVFGVVSELRPVMERKRGPKLTPSFEAVLPRVDFGKLIVGVETSPEPGVFAVSEDKPFTIDVRIFLRKPVLKAKVVYTEIGPEVVSTSTYVCSDAEGAKHLKQTLEDGVARGVEPFGPEAAVLFRNDAYTLSGDTLTLRRVQSQADLTAWLKGHPRHTLFLAD
jgi:hypothetical protein